MRAALVRQPSTQHARDLVHALAIAEQAGFNLRGLVIRVLDHTELVVGSDSDLGQVGNAQGLASS